MSEIVKFNGENNQIVDEIEDGAGKIQTIKFGWIKLLGEKTERRVSFRTLLQIQEMKERGFTGAINITELNMSVNASQIVMMRSDIEKKRITESFINLATAMVCLLKIGDKFELADQPSIYYRVNQIPHYEAKAHYVMKDGERSYILDFEKIKSLTQIDYDEGYEIVVNCWNYGQNWLN